MAFQHYLCLVRPNRQINFQIHIDGIEKLPWIWCSCLYYVRWADIRLPAINVKN